MKAKRVRRYRKPSYPTRLQVLDKPVLLNRNVPSGWRHADMAPLLAVFLAANTCISADNPKKSVPPGAAIVAPVFNHGEGRGAAGCVAVSPPVFLSEEEAMNVITDELCKAGITISQTNVISKDVLLPQRIERWRFEKIRKGVERSKVDIVEIPGKSQPLRLDVVDDKRHVAVTYVSKSKYYDLGGAQPGSTVSSYTMKDVASNVASKVGLKGKDMYFGAFYDPLVEFDMHAMRSDSNEVALAQQVKEAERTKSADFYRLLRLQQQAWKKRLDDARKPCVAEAQRLLRLQVKDFVDWLKGQGVI